MMRSLSLLCCAALLLLHHANSYAQPYVEGGNTRHRFAQMTVGAELLYVAAGGGSQYLQNGQLQGYSLPARLQPRLSIGGTHFWGHAEFYVAFDLPNLLDETVGPGTEARSSSGIETAFKVYPWRLEQGKLRPFVGSGMSVPGFQLSQGEETGAYLSRTIVPLTAGLTFQTGNLLLEVGGRYRLGRPQEYYVSRSQSTVMTPARLGFFAGLRYQLETTLSAEAPYRDGRTDALVAYLRDRGRLSGFSVAVGPSAGFTLLASKSTYQEVTRPFLGDHQGSGIFMEYGLGYYHAPWDAHLNLAYRRNASQVSAFGYQQRVGRRSLTLEAYKFLGDYHGFVPFLGPAVSFDRWDLRETDEGALTHAQRENRVLPGLTFGWDIRPDRTQWFILRTNLRYTPFRMATPGDTQLVLNQLEFNFIQLVVYPGRWAALRG